MKFGKLANKLSNDGRSREGAWIEIYGLACQLFPLAVVAPVRERGLKLCLVHITCDAAGVAPVRERGLKLPMVSYY